MKGLIGRYYDTLWDFCDAGNIIIKLYEEYVGGSLDCVKLKEGENEWFKFEMELEKGVSCIPGVSVSAWVR